MLQRAARRREAAEAPDRAEHCRERRRDSSSQHATNHRARYRQLRSHRAEPCFAEHAGKARMPGDAREPRRPSRDARQGQPATTSRPDALAPQQIDHLRVERSAAIGCHRSRQALRADLLLMARTLPQPLRMPARAVSHAACKPHSRASSSRR